MKNYIMDVVFPIFAAQPSNTSMKTLMTILLFIIGFSTTEAQIYCPEDLEQNCLMSTEPQFTGFATVISPSYHPSQVKYFDVENMTQCNEGFIDRNFYIDLNFDNLRNGNEPFCIHRITSTRDQLPLNISWPNDRTYSCTDDINVDIPTWSHHPCDMIAFNYEDEVFEFQGESCYKIIRHYTIINWCDYDEVTGEGIFEHDQVIKVEDHENPMIADCERKVFEATDNCEAVVTLTNTAEDFGDCPSGELTWFVSVDLWADGTDDLFYGPNEQPPFKIAPVSNGEEVSIQLPEAVSISKHKITWKVTDGCGNPASCSSEFEVVDNKPPTPYCLDFTSATLNGDHEGYIDIPASLFDRGSFDNCSSPEDLTISFSSNVLDTIKRVECTGAGFQQFNIYVTDEADNSDFCSVFMIVFDNGSCNGRFAPSGSITNLSRDAVAGEIALYDGTEMIASAAVDESGSALFIDLPLHDTYGAAVNIADELPSIDVLDMVILQRHLLGLEAIEEKYAAIADFDQNGRLGIDDLYQIRSVILQEIENQWFTFAAHQLEDQISYAQMIPYDDYHTGFDFIALATGDLSEVAVLGNTTTPRSESPLQFVIEEVDGQWYLTNQEEISYDGIQVNCESCLVENLGFRSGEGVFVSGSGAVAKKGLRILLDDQKHIPEIKIVLEEQNTVSEVEINSFSSQEIIEFAVYPNPFKSELYIPIEAVDVQVFTSDGESLPFELSGEGETQVLRFIGGEKIGLHFVRFEQNGQFQIHKVVRF